MRPIRFVPILITLTLAACGKDTPQQEANPILQCNSIEAQNAVRQIIENAIVDNLVRTQGPDGSPYFFNPDNIHATLPQMPIQLSQIQAEPNRASGPQDNGIINCQARISFTPSPELMQRAQESANTWAKAHQSPAINLAATLARSHNYSQGSYSNTINYRLLAAGGRNHPSLNTEVPQANQIAQSFNPLFFHYLNSPNASALVAAASQAASDTEQTDAIQNLIEQQAKAQYDLAQSENNAAKAQLSQAWQSLDADTKNRLLPSQSQWDQQRQAQCAAQVQAISDPTERDTARLKCDTQNILQHIPQLRQQAQQYSNEALNNARRANQQADAEIRRVWQQVPDDVKNIISADYQNWNNTLAARCATSATQSGGNPEIARLNCETQATQSKIDELRAMIPK